MNPINMFVKHEISIWRLPLLINSVNNMLEHLLKKLLFWRLYGLTKLGLELDGVRQACAVVQRMGDA